MYFRAPSSETSLSSVTPDPGSSFTAATNLVHSSKLKTVVTNKYLSGSGKRCQDEISAGQPGSHSASQPTRSVHPGSSYPAVSLVATSPDSVSTSASAPDPGRSAASSCAAVHLGKLSPVITAAQPADPRPAAESGGSHHRRFNTLERQGPQVPIVHEINGHKLHSHPGRQLDPNAPVFTPAGAEVVVSRQDYDSLDALDSILAGVDDKEEVAVRAEPPPPPCSCCRGPQGSCKNFVAEFVDLVSAVLETGVPNMDGLRKELPHKQIQPEPWERLLGTYFEKSILVKSLRFGWDFSLAADPRPLDCDSNLPSALEYPEHVDEYIRTELSYGSIVGPLPDDIPWQVYRSPLGTVAKPHCPDKRRVITDCSQRGKGINSYIRHDYHRGSYIKTTLPGTEEIVAAIKRTRLRFPGQAVKLFKSDYGRYYRQFLACPSQSPFLCVEWQGKKYADRSWSFGNRGCCQSSQRFSRAVAWIYRTQVPPARGVPNSGLACRCPSHCTCGDNEMEPYIDDSLGICPASHATWLYNSFVELVEGLTLRLSNTPGHISTPATVCVALGVVYNTVENTASLPDSKLADIREMLEIWTSKQSATPRELSSLAGRLLWCARVVPPGRLFLGRVLQLKRQADARPQHLARRSIQLDRDFRLDLQWWREMVLHWNGRSFLQPKLTCDIAVDASTDGWENATPGLGCYCYATNEFIATGVPKSMESWLICDLELFCYILCIRAWGHKWRGCQLNILTDNEPTRMLLEGGRSRNSLRLALAREIVGHQFSGDFRLHSSRIATGDNTYADALSRLWQPGQSDRFWQAVNDHGVAPTRTEVLPEWFTVSERL